MLNCKSLVNNEELVEDVRKFLHLSENEDVVDIIKEGNAVYCRTVEASRGFSDNGCCGCDGSCLNCVARNEQYKTYILRGEE